MKRNLGWKTYTLAAVLIVFTFLGCSGIELSDLETTTGSAVPDILAPVGEKVALEDYFYPSATLVEGKTTTHTLLTLTQDPSGLVNKNVSQTQKSFSKTTTATETIITLSVNDQIMRDDHISSDKIVVYEAENTKESFTYPYNVAQNDEVITTVDSDKVTKTCIVKAISSVLDLSPLIIETQTILVSHVTGSAFTTNQFVYADTLHVFCGDTNGDTEDIYYAKGIGKILSISEKVDLSKTYEILDKNSIWSN